MLCELAALQQDATQLHQHVSVSGKHTVRIHYISCVTRAFLPDTVWTTDAVQQMQQAVSLLGSLETTLNYESTAG